MLKTKTVIFLRQCQALESSSRARVSAGSILGGRADTLETNHIRKPVRLTLAEAAGVLVGFFTGH